MQKYIEPGGSFVKPYFVMVAFVVAYSGVAAVLANYVSPLSAGSGIPEIRWGRASKQQASNKQAS